MLRVPVTDAPDIALQEIDDLLDELARLTRTAESPAGFHGALLDRATRTLAAAGGVFWVPDAGGNWRIDARIEPPGGATVERLQSAAGHRALLDETLAGGQPRLILPGVSRPDGAPANPTEHVLLLCGVPTDSGAPAAGVLELCQRPGASPAAQQGALRLLAALCDVAADYHRQRLLQSWQDRAARVERVEEFVARVHGSLDVQEVAAAVANEGRRLAACDRLSVVEVRRGSCRILAVSGQESVDRRSSAVQGLEALAAAIVAAGDSVWHPQEAGALPPEIRVPLQAHLDEAHSQALAVIPLRAPADARQEPDRAPFAALVAERFSGEPTDIAFRERIDLVARHGAQALANARAHEGLPLYPLVRTLQRSRWLVEARQLPRTVLCALALAAAALALVVFPADFEVTGRGALQPALRREVFAGADGIVAEVRTEHGRSCRAGETLAVLTRSQLDFEVSRVLGELQTARTRLAGVSASRLESVPQTATERDKYNELAAEEQELQELVAGLESQRRVLASQEEELLVRSPIDGQVITWNVRDLLEARPVARGQALLTVANLEGAWILEIEVPDDRVGHVLAAQRELGPDLDVTFLLATDPTVTYHGRIESVAQGTRVEPDQPARVLVTVRLDEDQVPQRRPGATVVPRIRCGRRPLGYVWFHGVWEAIQKHVLF